MISLRQKITIPHLCIIVAIPLFILLLFNIAITYFASEQATKDLQNITHKVDKGLDFFEKRNIGINKIILLVHARNLSSSSELFLYTAEGKIVNPYSYIGTNSTMPTIAKYIRNASNSIPFYKKIFDTSIAQAAFVVSPKVNKGEIYIFSEKNKKYHAVKFTLTIDNKDVIAIFISSGNFSYEFVSFANKILIAISIFVICIGLLISKYITRSISRPIEYITDKISHVENDTFITLKNNSNIKELHVLSQGINSMSKKMYNYNQAQKNFFQNASHELRTPLTNIQGYAEGIEHGIFPDASKHARIISTEAQRMSSLVNDILSLSRIENNTFSTTYAHISAKQALQSALQAIQKPATNATPKIQLQYISDAVIYINEELFYQAISNIVFNALRYSKTHITITLCAEDNVVNITISDDGEGISAQDSPYIFDKFYKGKNGNFGLGLAIAKSAIESMQGSIFLKNTESGATFVVSLPQHTTAETCSTRRW